MIEVDNLSFTYPGATEPALRELTFAVTRGEILGFLGPSGAGKSTTLGILIGLLRGYRGQARVLGQEVAEWGSDFYESVGVSFELPNHHLRLSALENLEHFGALYRGPLHAPLEVLRWVNLEAHANRRVSEFSKGMKVRLNVARSLLHRPELLFLDEPTGGLDPVNAKSVRDLVRRLRDEGTTVFVTTHDLSVASALCDRVAFVCDGSVAALDSPQALEKRYGTRSLAVEWRSASGELERGYFPLDALGQNREFLELLQSGVRLETMHSQEATLEQVFFAVTGQELRP